MGKCEVHSKWRIASWAEPVVSSVKGQGGTVDGSCDYFGADEQ